MNKIRMKTLIKALEALQQAQALLEPGRQMTADERGRLLAQLFSAGTDLQIDLGRLNDVEVQS